MTQEAISDLGTGSHNLVGGAHVADIKQTGWDRGLPWRPGRGRGDDRDDFHLGEPRKTFQRRAPSPLPLMFIGEHVCRALTTAKDSDGVLVLGVPAAFWERQAHELWR